MGKAPSLHDYGLAASATQCRKASASSIGPPVIKIPCTFAGCSKSFGRKGDLKRHEQLHLGIRKHQCKRCGKPFSQKSGLDTHMNVHTGEKPYRCKFQGCGAEFGDPSSHARHKKETHLVQYAYKCPKEGCDSTIKRRSAFTGHIKKHEIVATPRQIDSCKVYDRSKLTQHRKPRQTSHARTATLAIPNIAAPLRDSPIMLHKIEDLNELSLSQEQDIRSYIHPTQRKDVPTFFSSPMASASTLSAFSSQSSTETFAEDFKFEDFTSTEAFYDFADHTRNISPLGDFTPSSSSSPMLLPFAKPAYRSFLPIVNPQDVPGANSQMAYRQRHIPNVDAKSISSSCQSYIVSQSQAKEYPYANPQLLIGLPRQNPSQQWQPWEFS